MYLYPTGDFSDHLTNLGPYVIDWLPHLALSSGSSHQLRTLADSKSKQTKLKFGRPGFLCTVNIINFLKVLDNWCQSGKIRGRNEESRRRTRWEVIWSNGIDRAPRGSPLYNRASKISKGYAKLFIAICNSYIDIVPGSPAELADVARGYPRGWWIPQFNTIGVDDGLWVISGCVIVCHFASWRKMLLNSHQCPLVYCSFSIFPTVIRLHQEWF